MYGLNSSRLSPHNIAFYIVLPGIRCQQGQQGAPQEILRAFYNICLLSHALPRSEGFRGMDGIVNTRLKGVDLRLTESVEIVEKVPSE